MSLQEKVHHLEKSREELSSYRDNLEREVDIRTRELETANEDLRKEIEERRRMEAEVRYRAYHDALTGLANRDLFSARLQEALDRDEPVAVLFMDLDGFKGVNDTLGHDMGDRLLQKIARRLKLEVSDRDTVARMGGDEFTIVVPSPPSRKTVEDLAARIRRRVSKKALLAGKEISVTASIGISLSPDHGPTARAPWPTSSFWRRANSPSRVPAASSPAKRRTLDRGRTMPRVIHTASRTATATATAE